MFGRSSKPKSRPEGISDCRAYVIGDIHGRLDLLETMLGDIEHDLVRQPVPRSVLVFVGDLIDRGPDSAGVLERLRTYSRRDVQTIFLLGNHEEVLLNVLAGDASLIRGWLRFGGAECLRSYGADPARLTAMPDHRKIAEIRSVIPQSHVAFLQGFQDTCRFGDYLFVHAGVRPGVELGDQRQADLRWIRDPFLTDETDHGFVVVHGHTVTPEIDERPNRIGIDTGAHASGVLSALAIEGAERWVIQARAMVEPAVSPAH